MARFYLRRFARPETLAAVDALTLWELLAPYRAFFEGRGLLLPPEDRAGTLDHEKLVGILLHPEEDTPQELAHALYTIHEMATPSGLDALIDGAAGRGIVLPEGLTPADVAVRLWLKAPDLVERLHAETCLARTRHFVHLMTPHPPQPGFVMPTEEQTLALETALDEWFAGKQRGRGTRVFVFPQEEAVWFLVRHGEPFRRVGTVEGRRSGCVCYRPERYDVLIYHPATGEIRLNAQSRGQLELYRASFGEHFFGSAMFFTGSVCYSLEPLRLGGADTLYCRDVPGLESIRLIEIQFSLPGTIRDQRIFRSSDVLSAQENCPWGVPEDALIDQASFRVSFSDNTRPRTVMIRPPNIARFTRDSDGSLIDRWLVARGLKLPRSAPDAYKHRLGFMDRSGGHTWPAGPLDPVAREPGN